jgi:hypothetical protein
MCIKLLKSQNCPNEANVIIYNEIVINKKNNF